TSTPSSASLGDRAPGCTPVEGARIPCSRGGGPMDTNEIVSRSGAAWNEPDDAARAELLAASWADAGVYQDPTATVEGRDALVAHIAGFQQTFSGHVIELTSAVHTNGAALRWGWAMRNGDEIVLE